MTEQFAVILPAAGKSVRFGGGRDKLLEPLGGRPVIGRTAGAFLHRADVGCVMLATDQQARLEPALRDDGGRGALDPRVTFCPGGASRAQSVLVAVRAVP